MTDDLRQRAIALYDRFTHEHHDRRAFLAEMTRLAGSVGAAAALIATIAPSAASAAIVPPDDKRLKTETIGWISSPGWEMRGYSTMPASGGAALPVVIVIHENRGLNDHIRDVARRTALAGFHAVAPDFLSPVGGTPADADAARTAIGKLDMAATVADGVASITRLGALGGSSRKVGIVGFCWGGAMVNRLAVAAGPALSAGVSFYGPAPDPSEAAQVRAPLMVHLAGLDERVNRSGEPWIAALKAAGKTVEGHVYPGVHHAFHNDTSAERYDAAAAKLAWDRTIAFFKERLA